MGVTLISISRVIASGADISFSQGACRIWNSEDEVVAEVPLRNNLWRVELPPLEVAAAGEDTAEGLVKKRRVVSIDKLHCIMGHISHEVARSMAAKGMVKGVILDTSSKPTVCESCENTKMSRKPILKERVRLRATVPGGELHSDVWGRPQKL
ncbi:hypothetical protein C8Q80DRAFT_1112477 [Daedaleopsis nitida]|nr:hypothetical protein C8Q80DRAFT_1112477 [Daedaleopsis nitida]